MTGTSLWSADAATKPRMPCCSGVLPVAIVVQIAGETVGSIERSVPLQPSATSRPRVGSFPAAMRGRITVQVAASMPMSRTRSPVGGGSTSAPRPHASTTSATSPAARCAGMRGPRRWSAGGRRLCTGGRVYHACPISAPRGAGRAEKPRGVGVRAVALGLRRVTAWDASGAKPVDEDARVSSRSRRSSRCEAPAPVPECAGGRRSRGGTGPQRSASPDGSRSSSRGSWRAPSSPPRRSR